MSLPTSAVAILETVSEFALVGSLAGTAAALRAQRLGFRLEPWAIIGRFTILGGLSGFAVGLVLELK